MAGKKKAGASRKRKSMSKRQMKKTKGGIAWGGPTMACVKKPTGTSFGGEDIEP